MRITEQHGDESITIRSLNAIAERERWSPDTRLSFVDPETESEMVVRGVALRAGHFGEGDSCIELATEHEDDWTEAEAVPDAVRAVLDRHLWRDRWKTSTDEGGTDDDAAGGWVGPAREALAALMRAQHGDGDVAAAEADFEDYRDYVLWQAMLDLARAEDDVACVDRGCSCTCHGEEEAK